jgi:hypothetical protein
MGNEQKSCPACGALPCDWVNNPHEVAPSPTVTEDDLAKINPRDEGHIMQLAEALFNYEPRNFGKRFGEASMGVRARWVDRAAWALSQTEQALSALTTKGAAA